MAGATALAAGVHVPQVRDDGAVVAAFPWAACVFVVPLPGNGDRWHHPRQDANAANHMVRGRMAPDHRQERAVREDSRTDAWRQVSRSVDHASAVPRGDGAFRAHAALR